MGQILPNYYNHTCHYIILKQRKNKTDMFCQPNVYWNENMKHWMCELVVYETRATILSKQMQCCYE